MKMKMKMKTKIKKQTKFRVFGVKSKTLLLFLLSFMLHTYTVNLFAQSEKLNLDIKNVPITEAFKLIKNQTQMSIVYNVSDLDVKQKVTVKASNETLSAIMEQILQGTNLSYAVEKNYIVLFTKNNSPERASNQNEAINIKGTVADNMGEPLTGVSVQVVGQSIGTITDIDGNYKLSIPAGSKTLIFSYIGYSS
jgi:hypothetical protein